MKKCNLQKTKKNSSSAKYPRQLSFIPKAKLEFGGSLLVGKRKEKRVLSFSKPMHFVFKSENAKNNLAFVTHTRELTELMNNLSRIYGVKLYDFAINFNHIHCVVRLVSAVQYKTWVRHLTSAIVGLLSKKAQTQLNRFFTLRPYSKIVMWGKQFKSVLNYQILNQLETFGLRPVKTAVKKNKLRIIKAKSRSIFASDFQSEF